MRLRCIPPTCFLVYFLRAVLPGFGSLPAGILPSRLTGLSCCFVAVVKNPPPSKKSPAWSHDGAGQFITATELSTYILWRALRGARLAQFPFFLC